MSVKSIGWSALVMAVSIISFMPIMGVLFPAEGVQGSDFTSGEVFLPFAQSHASLAALPYVIGIIMHVAGVILVVSLWRRLREDSAWAAVAAALGLVWMAFDIAYNGIAVHVIPELASFPSDVAVYPAYAVMARSLSALQLTGHLAGGVWLAITSFLAMRNQTISRGLGRLGLTAGFVFALSILGPTVLYPSYVLLPVWFGWLGVSVLRTHSEAAMPAPV